MKKFQVKLTGGIVVGGQIKRPGDIVEVDEKFARQLLHRGKGELHGAPEPEPVAEGAEDQRGDWSAMTVAELRALLPDAPARATKAELIALAEAAETAGDDDGALA